MELTLGQPTKQLISPCSLAYYFPNRLYPKVHGIDKISFSSLDTENFYFIQNSGQQSQTSQRYFAESRTLQARIAKDY